MPDQNQIDEPADLEAHLPVEQTTEVQNVDLEHRSPSQVIESVVQEVNEEIGASNAMEMLDPPVEQSETQNVQSSHPVIEQSEAQNIQTNQPLLESSVQTQMNVTDITERTNPPTLLSGAQVAQVDQGTQGNSQAADASVFSPALSQNLFGTSSEDLLAVSEGVQRLSKWGSQRDAQMVAEANDTLPADYDAREKEADSASSVTGVPGLRDIIKGVPLSKECLTKMMQIRLKFPETFENILNMPEPNRRLVLEQLSSFLDEMHRTNSAANDFEVTALCDKLKRLESYGRQGATLKLPWLQERLKRILGAYDLKHKYVEYNNEVSQLCIVRDEIKKALNVYKARELRVLALKEKLEEDSVNVMVLSPEDPFDKGLLD